MCTSESDGVCTNESDGVYTSESDGVCAAHGTCKNGESVDWARHERRTCTRVVTHSVGERERGSSDKSLCSITSRREKAKHWSLRGLKVRLHDFAATNLPPISGHRNQWENALLHHGRRQTKTKHNTVNQWTA